MDVVEEFDTVDFEQRLNNLKDTQDSIQQMSAWCLKHRGNHKKVVSSWLNVLKQVKVEHRLTLFHLANDVIQYSKRKNYEFVDSWGTTLQRATTMVRDEKVKNKIIRIFNIWEQRGIYNDEFLADLHGLLSINPTKKQQQVESDDEQASILASNIRNSVRLEKETDKSFKILSKTPLCDTENFHTLKDRRHVEDVEREIEEHANKLENYIKSLSAEIKARTILVAVLEQTDAFYHNQRGEVKVVANAYRNFGNRIKMMKRKIDELVTKLPSPIPSPDINAPSPEPDNDLDLPDYNKSGFDQKFIDKRANGFLGYMDTGKLPFDINDFKSESPKSDAQPITVISSQIVSKDTSDFNIDEFFKSILPESSVYTPNTPQPVPPVTNYGNYSTSTYSMQNSYNTNPPLTPANQYTPRPRMPNNHYGHTPNVPQYRPHGPIHPPPPPPPQYNQVSNYMPPLPRNRYPENTNYNSHNLPMVPPAPLGFDDGSLTEEYNPESWDAEVGWNSSADETFNTSTPASPPHFDREGVETETIEYIDQSGEILTSSSDVDHRQLRLPQLQITKVDVDHRNLISLTGSPRQKSDKEISSYQSTTGWKGDVDFRQTPNAQPLTSSAVDQFGPYDSDYRIPPPHSAKPSNLSDIDKETGLFSTIASRSNEKTNPFGTSQNIPGLTPPRESETPEIDEDDDVQCIDKPIVKGSHKLGRNRSVNDNVETIDMEMSDDEFVEFEDLTETNDGDSEPIENNRMDKDNTRKHSVHLFKKGHNQDRNENQNRQYHPPANKFAHRHFDHVPPGSRNVAADDNAYNNEGNNNINTSQPPPSIFQNQYRPSNPMFNSPPPNFNRPPTMGNCPPQNRIWNDGHNNPGNVNQNHNFPQSHNVWNTPPHARGMNFQQNMNRMNSPRNVRGMPYNNPFSSGPRFGSFNMASNHPNNNINSLHQNNRSSNPSQNINNLTSPVIDVNNSEPNFPGNQHLDQDDRVMPEANDKELSAMQSETEICDQDDAKQDTDIRQTQEPIENPNKDNDDRLKLQTNSNDNAESTEPVKDATDNNAADQPPPQDSINLHNVSETDNSLNENELDQSKDETKTDEIPQPSISPAPRKHNPFSQPPRIAAGLFSSIDNCSTQMLNNLFHHNNIEGQGTFRSPSPAGLNQMNPRQMAGGNRPMPLLMTPPGVIPPLMRGGLNRGASSGGSPYFRPNLNDGLGGGVRGGWGGNNGGMRLPGPMRGMSPANRRGIGGNTMMNNGNRGRISDPGPGGNFRGNFRGNW